MKMTQARLLTRLCTWTLVAGLTALVIALVATLHDADGRRWRRSPIRFAL
jgi:hypothetical protein